MTTTCVDEAENMTEQYLRKKYPTRFRFVRFSQVNQENERWVVKAELDLSRTFFPLRVRHQVSMEIDPKVEKVISYKEGPAVKMSVLDT